MKIYISFRQSGMYLLVAAICMLADGCKKFTDVSPPSTQLVSETVFVSDNALNSAIAGMYSTMITTNNTVFQLNLGLLPATAGDELVYYGGNETYDPFFKNVVPADNALIQTNWTALYKIIFLANSIITGVEKSTGGLTESLKVQATAEAKFIRAFCHFYLVNLYGAVPIVTGIDAQVNNNLFRSSPALVYQQILDDLKSAQAGLREDYSVSGSERVRPNKYAATALLARAYLFTEDWTNAELEATKVITKNTLYSLVPKASISDVFVKNNTEAIFQMSSAQYVGFTLEGSNYVRFALPPATPYFVLTNSLQNAFESTTDARFVNWLKTVQYTTDNVTSTFYYPNKYKQRLATTTAAAEYFTFLRLGEQFLIRAEARAKLDNSSGAKADLDVIRLRANLQGTSATGIPDLLRAIERERRVELFGELGHRWFDLKRTGRLDAVMSVEKPAWKSGAALFPIPLYELNNNTNLQLN